MSADKNADVVVIGAGIVGVMAALYLQADGRNVLLIERDEVASGASAGNAGILAFPEIIPIPSPGVMLKAPKWLLDPLGPLSIPPAYALKITPWLWHFWRASSRAAFARGIAAQTDMMGLAATEMQHVRGIAELASFFDTTGTLDLYDSEKSFNAAAPDWLEKEKAGFQFTSVGRTDIERLQPGLAPQFRHAMYSPDGVQVNDPQGLARAVADLVVARGATLRKGRVMDIAPTGDMAVLTLADGATITATTVVLAGGAWSKTLAARLGDPLPLETERGYNTTLPAESFPLRRQLYFNDHAFVVTPLSNGIRVGGAVELGGLELPPSYRRSQALLAKAARFLPEMKTEGGREWMGFRPSMPDCLPVIGRSSASPAVLYAFGHGHLGLTQSAATGRLVCDLAAGRPQNVALAPFHPGRFR
ncbi:MULTISPECIES: NAD(P)/FAD-dependent oxidoreductase [Alphaproteobacteria]|uniref:D-amino-acid dehydrogenase n=2 Tax=Alphaproteobacteria TaxID=28211 RepID=A0A512HQ24_9HYPH|nr:MULTISPECIES: FAD-binding oxidoreductase [Alphaproteobacteria]GEO87554.1 D-amino-acid dehydrogenase [Ciceribacter naphthalenivorans]GLR23539.1 D-amino-acid dehydrogenase [Ciceribacter naphthalenivorans]GLT06395.1 D-amino-acid dehydrogenase [Sphingomonas psychrolutea]